MRAVAQAAACAWRAAAAGVGGARRRAAAVAQAHGPITHRTPPSSSVFGRALSAARPAGSLVPSHASSGAVASSARGVESGAAASSSGDQEGARERYRQAMEGLSEEQRAAVEAPLGPVRVVAGPGSGKTRVLTARCAHLMHAHGVAPWEVAAITFTNKAAAELKERLSVLLGEARASRLTAGTFHALCLRMLRRPGGVEALPLAGRDARFTVYDEDASYSVLKRLVKDARPEWKGRNVMDAASQLQSDISAVKNALPTTYGMSAEEAVVAYRCLRDGPDLGAPELEAAQALAGWMAEYERALQASNACDFDDLLGLAVALLQRVPAALERFRGQWRHLLVDEFQDTNSPQYALARLLAGPEGSLFVVGDPDQAIYGFRGADVANMQRQFLRDFPSARVFFLRDNYRSTAHILRAAQHVIDCNADWERRSLRALNPPGARVQVHQLPDSAAEAEFIADSIQALSVRGEHPLEEVAVLYRRHTQAKLVEEELIRRRIPYVLVGGVPFWKRAEVQDVMAYLRLAVGLRDEVALLRVINTPARKIGDTTVERLRTAAAERGAPLPELLFGRRPPDAEDQCEVVLPPLPDHAALGITRAAAAALEEFRALVAAAGAAVAGQPLGEALEEILRLSKYREHVAEGKCGSDDKHRPDLIEERLERLDQLRGTVTEFEEAGGTSLASAASAAAAAAGEGSAAVRRPRPRTPEERLTLAGAFLDEAALCSVADAGGAGAPGVRLLTIHAAKGLEFECVFVPGCVEGNMPLVVGGRLKIADLERIIEEERRLFFVAMTRAKARLHLLHTRLTRVFGHEWRKSEPSMFLEPVLASGAADKAYGRGHGRAAAGARPRNQQRGSSGTGGSSGSGSMRLREPPATWELPQPPPTPAQAASQRRARRR